MLTDPVRDKSFQTDIPQQNFNIESAREAIQNPDTAMHLEPQKGASVDLQDASEAAATEPSSEVHENQTTEEALSAAYEEVKMDEIVESGQQTSDNQTMITNPEAIERASPKSNRDCKRMDTVAPPHQESSAGGTECESHPMALDIHAEASLVKTADNYIEKDAEGSSTDGQLLISLPLRSGSTMGTNNPSPGSFNEEIKPKGDEEAPQLAFKLKVDETETGNAIGNEATTPNLPSKERIDNSRISPGDALFGGDLSPLPSPPDN